MCMWIISWLNLEPVLLEQYNFHNTSSHIYVARVRLNKGLRFQNVAPTKVILVHFSVHSLRCHSNFLYIDRVYALGTHFKLRIKLNFRLVQSNCLLELFARRRSVTSYCQRCFPEIRLLHTNSDVRKKSFERK